MNTQKIVLVNPRVHDIPQQPIGLMMIAAVLEKAGYIVKIIDPYCTFTIERTVNIILSEKPDIVGLTVTTYQVHLAFGIADMLKERKPDLKIIFGGVHVTCRPQQVIGHPSVDYIVVGEGESTVIELCSAIFDDNVTESIKGIGFKQNGSYLITQPRPPIDDLNSLPFPARHLIESEYYLRPPKLRGIWTNSTVMFMSSRGCPYRCIFCTSNIMWGRKVRRRDPENMMEELRICRRRYDMDGAWFADDTFTLHPTWVAEFCELIIRENWKDFRWVCQARVNTITEDLLKLMRRAGCVQLEFGIESGSPHVLKILKKDTDVEMIRKAIILTRKLGLRALGTFIIGTPGETVSDLQLTESLVRDTKLDYAEFFYCMPLPCSELYSLARENGFDPDTISYAELKTLDKDDEPLMTFQMSRKEMKYWKHRLQNMVFTGNYMIFLKEPKYFSNILNLVWTGKRGIPDGLKRFTKTYSMDDIMRAVILEYRKKLFDNDFPYNINR